MSLENVVDAAKALGDASRMRALLACRRRELCVCQITELLGLAPSTVSKHLSILKRAGLLESRKRGRWIFYRVPERPASKAAREALAFVGAALARDGEAAADRRQIEAILAVDPDELCARQRCAGKGK